MSRMLVYQLCFLLLFVVVGKALIREDQEFGGSQVPGRDQSKQHLNFLIISYTPSFTDHIINIVKEIYDRPTFRASTSPPQGAKASQAVTLLLRSAIPHSEKQISICCGTSLPP